VQVSCNALLRVLSGLQHLDSAGDGQNVRVGYSWKVFSGDWTGDKGDMRSSPTTGFSQSFAHFTAAVIADITNRIEMFVGGTGKNQDLTPLQVPRCERFLGYLGKNLMRFRHPPGADNPACQITGIRSNPLPSDPTQLIDIFLHHRLPPHLYIHGRTKVARTGIRQ
jgi:hypothetical protein